jgi:hypothetical protein
VNNFSIIHVIYIYTYILVYYIDLLYIITRTTSQTADFKLLFCIRQSTMVSRTVAKITEHFDTRTKFPPTFNSYVYINMHI